MRNCSQISNESNYITVASYLLEILINDLMELPYFFVSFNESSFLELEITSCKAEQPLREMELKDQEVQKD